MYGSLKDDLCARLAQIKADGLYKNERIITTPQSSTIKVNNGSEVLNFCANNYLGLANNIELREAAKKALDTWGYGLSSVRFICGTQEIHKQLELKMSSFLSMEDTILFSSCFDANGAIFEPLMDADCAIITDSLNHASIIDGIRLAKAERFIYEHNNFDDLEKKLQETAQKKYRLIATDGVFSMDGDIADLNTICDLAEKYNALVMVDDSHATGFIGKTGRGTWEHCNVKGRIDIITTTFGKALGGASGGCISGKKEIIEYLRQKARPYLFSNTLAPSITAGTIAALDILTSSTDLRDTLEANTKYFRDSMTKAGFDIRKGTHPITPVMLYDEKLAGRMAEKLLLEGIYVIGFSFPVVPKGKARIRTQISAAHTKENIDTAVAAFIKIGKQEGVIK